MARLRFLKGVLTGRLGDIVGSSWKGIHYIKTYSKPANPRTKPQTAVRTVFLHLAHFATALKLAGIDTLIPAAQRMTARNSTIKANTAMFKAKVFSPAGLQVTKGNFSPIANANPSCTFTPATSTDDQSILFTPEINWSPDVQLSSLVQHIVFYNHASGTIFEHVKKTPTIPLASQGVSQDIPNIDPAECVALLFVTGVTDSNEKIISPTIAAPFLP